MLCLYQCTKRRVQEAQGNYEARTAERARGNSSEHRPGATCMDVSESSGNGLSLVPVVATRLRGPGGLIRVLPLGDTDHRSPSRQYPAPAEDIWAARPGPKDAPCAIRPTGCLPDWGVRLNDSDTAAGRLARRASQ